MVLSDRVKKLRRLVVDDKVLDEKILAVYPMLYDEGAWYETQKDSCEECTRVAAGMEHVMRHAPAYILDGELIVGYHFADRTDAVFWSPGDTPGDLQRVLKAGFTREQYEEQQKRRKELLRYQMNGRFDSNCFSFDSAMKLMGDERFPFLKEYTPGDIMLNQEWAAMGRCITDNHTIIGYERVLQKGFNELLKDILDAECENGPSAMYDAMKRLCHAAGEHAANYADKARSLARQPDCPPERRDELLEIERICRQVPMSPAHTFHEALQSLVFAHIFSVWEDGVNANSLGRLDQILYPYYIRDIAQGRLTRDQAFELICCLWLKLYRDYDVQQSCVGGCDANGQDAVNDLSYMMLDATEQLGFVRCLSVRYGANTDKQFLRRALEVVGRVQKGIPFFFNDDVVIPSLLAKGILPEDARNYSQLGCVETAIPGMSNPHAVSGETNLLKALEYVLGNGHSLIRPEFKPGLTTGEPEQFADYEAFYQAVCAQIENILDVTCKWVANWRLAAAKYNPKPYKSMLTDDCIRNNLDFNNQGARYDFYQIMLGGIPNLADSLLAVKRLVFEQKQIGLAELAHQLRNNFPDERLRQQCLHHTPKFGNDEDEVDTIACDILNFSCDVLDRLESKYHLCFFAQPFTYLWMIPHGERTAASPDGRRCGEPIAYSVSPMQGRDTNGLTALINSLSKLPTTRCPGVASAIVEVEPVLFQQDNIDLLADILLVGAERGLSNVQFNTVDAQTLLDAQAHPEQHGNLAVRVSGFSQKFNLLDKPLQDHIIARTKHACL